MSIVVDLENLTDYEIMLNASTKLKYNYRKYLKYLSAIYTPETNHVLFF